TAFYVPPSALEDFLHADDAAAPGVLAVARATGRDRFHVFGEGFAIDHPGEDRQARRIDTLMRDADGHELLPGMLNFPLYGTLADVFARGRPTSDLRYRIESIQRVHAHPHLMPTFVDNHDVDRFLAGGDVAGLEQALLALMTLPGIPTIYYGTEQAFAKQRASMFAGGVESGGVDHFDAQAPMYRFLQEVIALRREHRVLSRGVPTVLRDNAAGPGVIAWRMDGEGEPAIVAMNTATTPALLANMDTGLPAGSLMATQFNLRFEDDFDARPVVVDADGRVTVSMPPRSAVVWRGVHAVNPSWEWPPTPGVALASGAPSAVEGDFIVQGTAQAGVRELQLVVDDDLSAATRISVGSDGRWQGNVDTSTMADGGVEHQLVAASLDGRAASQAHRFRVRRAWKVLADAADAVGDDRGRNGKLTYPTDPSWGTNRQLDIERVRVLGAQGALAVEVSTHAVTTSWNPANGFDHVAFTVFIELPDAGPGARVMPLQNAALPGAMRWHYRLRAHGWSNALTSAEGASATNEGRAATPAATLQVDPATDTVRFVLPARSLGNRASLSGARIHVSTWDYDGGFRPLALVGGEHAFGGGDGSRDPLVMDESAVIVVP
ncbi:MAG: glucodextranase DOMON-like domain-containing protein, partial [Arenimonas sp.]